MVKKITLTILSVIVILVIFFEVKYKEPASTSTEKHLTVLLDWYISPDQGPLLIAKINGYFQQHHLDVDLVELSDSSQAPKLIAQKKADLAISYGGSYLDELKQGLPVKQIGTLIDRPLNCLVYLPNSGIHTPEDLKGKRVGFTDPNDDFRLLKAVLKAGNLSINDVILINIQSTLLQSLILGKIDISTDMLRNVEPIVLRHRGFSPLMFCPENFDVPTYSELIYIIHNKNTSQTIQDFLLAVAEGTLYIEQHPEEAWKKMKAAYPKLDTDIYSDVWNATYPLFAKDPKKI